MSEATKSPFKKISTDPKADFFRKMYPTEIFNKTLDEVFGKEKKDMEKVELTEDDEIVAPKLLFLAFDEKTQEIEMGVVAFAGGIPENKGKFFSDLGAKLAESHFVIGAFYCSEVWIGMGGENGEMIPPSQQENRQDGYSVFGMTLDGRVNFSSCVLKKIGKRVMLGTEQTIHYDPDGEQELESNLLRSFFGGYVEKRYLQPKTGDVPEVTVNTSTN
jgi:hypothetical protein